MYFLTTWCISAVRLRVIRSKARKGGYQPADEESILFANEVKDRWNAAHPLQLVVSDITMFKVGTTYWKWTILLDTFNNEIPAHSVTSLKRKQQALLLLLGGVEKADGQKRRANAPSNLTHRDQGAGYSSRAFARSIMLIT